MLTFIHKLAGFMFVALQALGVILLVLFFIFCLLVQASTPGP